MNYTREKTQQIIDAHRAAAGAMMMRTDFLVPDCFEQQARCLAGHTALVETAAALLGRPVAFEVSAVNVDKPPLPPAAVLDRLSQFAGRYPVYAANAPTFNLKARLYPGAVFVVGFDTAARIVEPRYYGDSQANMLVALDELRQRGNRFLVAGRLDDDGLFHELPELALPAGYEALFEAIPARLFRHDISSTAIRAALKAEA